MLDDESMIRDAMKQLLEHCGCEVEAFDNGPAALARLAEHSFDLVITDFSMPGMPGDQFVARVRDRWPNQRIIMATAFVEEYKVFGQPAAAVDGLLYKPFTFKNLRDVIDEVLAREIVVEEPSSMPSLTEGAEGEAPPFIPPPNPDGR